MEKKGKKNDGVLTGSRYSRLGGLHIVWAISMKVSSHSCAVTGVLVTSVRISRPNFCSKQDNVKSSHGLL